MNKLYLITGPAGVGKSTVSYALGEKLDKSVVIEGDTIYNFFVGGKVKPWENNAPLELFWNNVIMLIKSYLENGYNVVFNYIIKDNQLNMLKKEFKDYDINFSCLLTDEKTILERDKLRSEDCQMKERCLILLKSFKDCNFSKNDIIDSSNLTISDTVDLILNKK